jgi:hypothetical protein
LSKQNVLPDNKIEILFSVSDTGMGILPENKNLFFTVFNKQIHPLFEGASEQGLALPSASS